MDAVTIARCTAGHRATKLIRGTQDGDFTIDGYDAGKYLAAETQAVAGLGDLAAVLNKVAADPRSYVLRGELLPDIDPRRCRRLLYTHEDGTPPTFREVPRRWVVIDFDNVPGPYRFDPRDGELAAIYCRTLLPEPWHRCSYWWGLSSSAGFKPGVRIKLAFWLDRPALGKELERHLKGCPIDVSTLRAVQPIYVARPILVGVADPIRQRTGVEHDLDDQVTLPELPAEASQPGARHALARTAGATSAAPARTWPSGAWRRSAAP